MQSLKFESFFQYLKWSKNDATGVKITSLYLCMKNSFVLNSEWLISKIELDVLILSCLYAMFNIPKISFHHNLQVSLKFYIKWSIKSNISNQNFFMFLTKKMKNKKHKSNIPSGLASIPGEGFFGDLVWLF